MLEKILKKLLFGWLMDRAEKKDKKKYLMYVCGSDTDRAKEPEITAQIAAFLKEKCGSEIV